MNLVRLFRKAALLIGGIALVGALASCQPKTLADKICALEKQVKVEAQTLNQLETKQFTRLEKDFAACDSLLQFLHPEEVEAPFQQLQLVGAYIEQFKATRPVMLATRCNCQKKKKVQLQLQLQNGPEQPFSVKGNMCAN